MYELTHFVWRKIHSSWEGNLLLWGKPHFPFMPALLILQCAVYFTRTSLNNQDTRFGAFIQKKGDTTTWIQVSYSTERYNRKPTSCPGCAAIVVIILRAEQLWNLNSEFRAGLQIFRRICIDIENFLLILIGWLHSFGIDFVMQVPAYVSKCAKRAAVEMWKTCMRIYTYIYIYI